MSDQTSLIPPEHILPDAQASGKCGLVTELCSLLTSVDTDQAIEVVMEREKLGSTGIGCGIAIPHGRLPDLAEPIVALARHIRGVDFESIDGEPAHIIVLLLAPEKEDKSHLELLARIAQIMQKESVRNAIMKARDAEEISRLVAEPAQQAA